MPNQFDFRLTSALPGGSWGGIMRDSMAQPMLTDEGGHPLRGGITMAPETRDIQADQFHAPVPHAVLHVRLDGSAPYDVLVQLTEISGTADTFLETMARVLPAGVKATRSLRDGILAASFAPETWPVHDKEYVANPEGLWASGKRLANKVFTIAGESKNAYGEKTFILRKEDGTRVMVDAADLPLGGYGYLLDAQIYDGVELFLHLTREWSARTDAEKHVFEIEPLRQAAEKARQAVEKKASRFPGFPPE
jgi:hypothetical protein